MRCRHSSPGTPASQGRSPRTTPDPRRVSRVHPTPEDRMTTDTAPAYVAQGKAFDRDMSYIPDRITAEPGRSRDDWEGSGVEAPTWPVEPGRYRLVAAKACPWANRSIIVRQLLGLEDVISLGTPGPTHDADSWTFDLDE